MNHPKHDCWDWRPSAPSRLAQPVTLLRLQGPDTLRTLHGQTSQAIELAAPGRALATCLISPTARLRALAQVLVDGSGAWLLIEAGDGDAVRAALDRVLFPADRVALGPLQSAQLITPVLGGNESALPAALPSGEAGRWQPCTPDGAGEGQDEAWLLGHQLLLRDESTPLPEGFARRAPLTPHEQERWRLQQGIPAAPGELNDDCNPFELGLADRVSLNKGCYVGQETLAKLATYDGVKQQLRRWCWRQPPGQGASKTLTASLVQGQPLVQPGGERAGQISSVLALPQADGSVQWLGLALVRRSALQQVSLSVGEQGPELAISKPEAFVDPPVSATQRRP